ncbi:hypothetical protein QTO34_008426 [Cnephaeus nilssonii]|uniref:COMM domain-containing protein n=1 Tax=Cnephaeus nilssonii TaxID=3371016 RepID=A0AA40LTV4_CNENI|nr:hypothetical protein QTO34_008426 [Eptesicus nilssonii]
MESEEGTPLWRLQKLPAERGPQVRGARAARAGGCGSAWRAGQAVHRDAFAAARGPGKGRGFGCRPQFLRISQQLNQLNSSHQEAIMKCLKSRKDEIKQTLLNEIVDISSAQLQDFDWQLKLALSSDKIATLQMPLLNLHLDVKENGEVKPYSIEMSQEELQNLINSLEAANKVFVLILFCGLKCLSFDRYQ